MPHLLTAAIRAAAASSITTACMTWLSRLIARLLARQLQVPEALVHAAGLYVYAQIDSFERQLLHGLLGRGR